MEVDDSMSEGYDQEFYDKLNKISVSYTTKYRQYIEKINKKEDYSELEKELNDLLKESNELQGVNVVYNKR